MLDNKMSSNKLSDSVREYISLDSGECVNDGIEVKHPRPAKNQKISILLLSYE